MKRTLIVLALVCAVVGVVAARQAGQYPVAESIAMKIIQKYQTSSCQQLWAERMTAPTEADKANKAKAVAALQADPKMRQAFIGMVAAPIANKMFECGMIP